MSEVLVDGYHRLVFEPETISVGPGWKVVWVEELEMIMIDRGRGVIWVPKGTEVQAFGEVLPPLPPPPLLEGSVIDAGQTRGPQG